MAIEKNLQITDIGDNGRIGVGEVQGLVDQQVELGYTSEELVGVESYLRYLLDLKESKKHSNIEIVAVGDIILDVFHSARGIKPNREGGNEVIAGSGEMMLGGAGGVILGLVGFAEKVHVITRVGGKDEDLGGGEEVVRRLEKIGVDTMGVFVDWESDTPVKTRFTDAEGRVLMGSSLQPSPLSQRLERQIIDRIKRLSEMEAGGVDVRLVVSDYARGVCTPAVFAAIDALLREKANISCLIDPRPVSWVDDQQAGEKNAKYNVWGAMLTPNRREAEALTGMEITGLDSALACGRRILEMLPRLGSSLLLKLDSDGAIFVEQGGASLYLPPTLFAGERVLNPSGGGDVVLAALALHPKLEMPVGRKDALRAAMWLGGACVLEANSSNLSMELIETTLERVNRARLISTYGDDRSR